MGRRLRTSPPHRPTSLGQTPPQTRAWCSGPRPSALHCISGWMLLRPSCHWHSPIGQMLPGTRACSAVWLQLIEMRPMWPRMQGQLWDQNKLFQMWYIGHQPLIIIIPSHQLKLGEHTWWVICNDLIHTCPHTIIKRISIHFQMYNLLQDARPHSPSLIMHPLGFMCTFLE